MSARDVLFINMVDHPTTDEASQLIDDFAHELAERIRRAYSGEGPDEDTWIRNPFDAADLIDPEVDA